MKKLLFAIFYKWGILWSGTCAIVLTLLLCSPKANSADLVTYSLCDVRVLYLFDDPRTIDWPVLYYLNDNYGC
ncbi:MAG: hypothetical protein U9R56_02530, partial [candidate division Zixibacteria bacterium]|nr:hypothetical protein [candidate division Zixibacteria bacterium]